MSMSNGRKGMTRDERRAADRRYAEARERLNAYEPEGGVEDTEYLRLNGAVIEAEQSAGLWAKLRS
jgi:hypothetical protein